MRTLLAILTVAVVVFSIVAMAADTGPEKLVFPTKMGNVTFQHAKHVEREKGDCKVCHDKLWPQSAKAPLNFKAGMHKPAEANHTSCGACHSPQGPAFATAGNCAKCHVKG